MPVEQAKEVAKVAVEASGSWVPALQWVGGILGTTGAVIFGVWKHVTTRVEFLEREAAVAAVIKMDLDDHIKDENRKFQTLFDKHDQLSEKLHTVGEAVARIEGKLER